MALKWHLCCVAIQELNLNWGQFESVSHSTWKCIITFTPQVWSAELEFPAPACTRCQMTCSNRLLHLIKALPSYPLGRHVQISCENIYSLSLTILSLASTFLLALPVAKKAESEIYFEYSKGDNQLVCQQCVALLGMCMAWRIRVHISHGFPSVLPELVFFYLKVGRMVWWD